MAMNIITASIIDERLENNKARGKYRDMLVDFYEENQQESEDYLKKWGFEKKSHLPLTSTRLVKRVIDTLSMVYKRPPQRWLTDDQGNPIDDDGLQEFISDNPMFNLQMKKLERYYNLLKNVLFRFAFDPDREQFYFYIETDYIPEFGKYNKLYPIGYHIPLPHDTDSKIVEDQMFLYISDDEYYFHDGKSEEKIPDEAIGDIINPYGIMPLIDFSDHSADGYWNMGARSLVEVARHLNIGMLTTAHGHHFQSFDQPWIRGMQPENLNQDRYGKRVMEVGSDTVWMLGDDGAAGLLGYSPKLVESVEFYRGWLNMELSNYGLKATFREDGNPMSGFALQVSNMELLEKRESDIDVYKSKEQELYRIIRRMNEYHGLGYNMPDGARLMTDFVEPSFPAEPQEERAQAEWEWKNNLSTREDYLIQRNPDLTQEEAMKQIDDNRSNNRETRGLFPGNDTQGAVEQNT